MYLKHLNNATYTLTLVHTYYDIILQCFFLSFDVQGFNCNHLTFHSENGFHHHVSEYKGIMAPEGEGCPRCGCFVYAAEQMLARGRVCIGYYLNFGLREQKGLFKVLNTKSHIKYSI